MPRILFVSGFHPSTRARDLAYEFERYGPLIRCDVPAPRNPNANSNPYAFVEFRSPRDAEDAYYDMHGRYFDGSRISIQWAKNPPSSVWRYDRDRRSPPRRDRDRARSRSRSPRRSGRDSRESRDRREDRDRGRDRDSDRDRERDRDRDRDRERDREEKDKDKDKDRESEKEKDKRRSSSPETEKRREDRDNARTPPPPVSNGDDIKKEEDKAQTPPYES